MLSPPTHTRVYVTSLPDSAKYSVALSNSHLDWLGDMHSFTGVSEYTDKFSS